VSAFSAFDQNAKWIEGALIIFVVLRLLIEGDEGAQEKVARAPVDHLRRRGPIATVVKSFSASSATMSEPKKSDLAAIQPKWLIQNAVKHYATSVNWYRSVTVRERHRKRFIDTMRQVLPILGVECCLSLFQAYVRELGIHRSDDRLRGLDDREGENIIGLLARDLGLDVKAEGTAA
jgi:hypothetical protein